MFDYPIFEMPFIGHRLLFAFDAILHVFISHGAAVGGSIILVLSQWLAIKNNDAKLDALSYKILFTFFILATAVGALTGIGIWIHINIINPAAIGALLRVFFWKWLIEWIVFNVEMILLLWLFLIWKKHSLGTPGKKKVYKLLVSYAVASWFTMAIITAILGFMMTPGNWLVSYFPAKPDYLASLLNPSWFPSLGFRTFWSIAWAGSMAMVLSYFFTRDDLELRKKAMRLYGAVLLGCIPFIIAFGAWYYAQFPQAAKELFWMGMVTRRFAGNPEYATYVTVILSALVLLGAITFYTKPKQAPLFLGIIMLIGSMGLIGGFERVREFVRKPYIIYDYMYANGVRVADVPYLNKTGYLKHAAFVPPEFREVTDENRLVAGKYLYQMQCRYCHTVNGINSVKARTKGMSEEAIYHRIGSLNSPATPFMPPFTGTDDERKALAAYLASLAEQTPANVYKQKLDEVSK
ncbi:cytochrome c [Methylotenera sp.]|uniref:c-type cytochrome n=1 Tax=Methylotenera sp. TaxID=2051956 RepID=UPI002726157C|nr:cytochrome c [Methylotenera sp.]MDO9204962.1 cytochrome c [Methylotenera sp.]MDO9393687.1 cytochrome c [Methylotenera sp.]MDP1523511.1 cytochrome c [Methylotenera sp.]MDP2071150.1 cytochrome c [Methylotenera sp.]MDP2230075.1 cytochrome c [Methylotenera sp.]